MKKLISALSIAFLIGLVGCGNNASEKDEAEGKELLQEADSLNKVNEALDSTNAAIDEKTEVLIETMKTIKPY